MIKSDAHLILYLIVGDKVDCSTTSQSVHNEKLKEEQLLRSIAINVNIDIISKISLNISLSSLLL